ncbi:hypothetical protein [Amycolatopsis balhimycina]|nr:hypothetical protein [Amycolatopsis balhimycina]
MGQEPGTAISGEAAEPARPQTMIDEMTPEDWANAKELLARFDAERGTR